MEIKLAVDEKWGALITPLNNDTYSNLSSLVEFNSHEYPEIKLNSSQIQYSGSEDSQSKMKIVASQFDFDINFEKIYQEVFERCEADTQCSQAVPSILSLVN